VTTPTGSAPEPSDAERVQASLDAITAMTGMTGQMPGIVCAACGRARTLADDYDYTPLQLITGRPLGWFNGDGEQMCGDCLGLTMNGQLP
jgi:hypothetical protein